MAGRSNFTRCSVDIDLGQLLNGRQVVPAGNTSQLASITH